MKFVEKMKNSPLNTSYVIHEKTLNNFRDTNFSPVLKPVRKMSISSIFEGFVKNQNCTYLYTFSHQNKYFFVFGIDLALFQLLNA